VTATTSSARSRSRLPVAPKGNTFFPPPHELSAVSQFGYALGAYRRKSALTIRRLPSGKATIYFAKDVRTTSGARIEAGLFCEGPRAKIWELDAECGEVIGFRVRAGVLDALLGRAARELRGLTVPLDEVWGSKAAALLDRILGAASSRDRRQLLARALIGAWREHAGADEFASRIARAIERQQGRTPIALLAERAGVSQRFLLRKFDECVGLTPKQYARIVRLRTTLARLADARGDLAGLALDRGFTDHAHLIHEFQDLIGCAPAEFADQRDRFGPLVGPSLGLSALPKCERQLYPWLGCVSFWL
jgi:AraC-like DNA-binding protein